MTIKAKPWKPETMRGRYMVNIYIRFDDGTYRERPVIDARSIKDAERWGEARVGEIHAERKAKPVVVAPVAVAAPVAPVGNGETVSAWYERYYREAELGRVGNKNHGKPQVSVTERRGRFRNHIKPLIGDRPIAAVTEDELRAIVEILDDKIRLRVTYYADLDPTEEREGAKPGMSWKNAAHIWSEITSGFREARGSKLADLRIAGMADITKDVFPPMRVEDRVQAALLPIELTTLLACEVVPLERRRCYAMAAYLGARYSELRLTADDIDFEHMLVTVNGSKTAAARRRVPIEKSILPLLRLLVAERPFGLLVDLPPSEGGDDGAAGLARADLRTAGITRADLFADNGEQMQFTFHGFRHTAITHAYVAGRDETHLKIVYGHTSSTQTRRYLDTAALGRSTFGTPFPPLPVLGGGTVVSITSRSA